jgi:hypothetical protein
VGNWVYLKNGRRMYNYTERLPVGDWPIPDERYFEGSSFEYDPDPENIKQLYDQVAKLQKEVVKLQNAILLKSAKQLHNPEPRNAREIPDPRNN